MNMHVPRFTPEEIGDHQRRIQNIVIEHSHLLDVEDELRRRLLTGGSAGSAKLTMFVAPSGWGKSTTVRQAIERLIKTIGTSGSIRPILYASLPVPCTIKMMTTALLRALNDPLAERHGTTGQNSMRIIEQLRVQGVRLVILDEFQHLVSGPKQHIAYEATDWLKQLLDHAGVPVVCVGLPESTTVISEHEQLRRRTTKLIQKQPFCWDEEGGVESTAFRAFLHIYEKQMGFPDPSHLGAYEFAERIHIASKGLIGVVSQLALEAAGACLARTDGPICLTLEDFAEAFACLPYDGVNPFDPRRTPSDLRSNQIAVSRKAGPRA